MQVHWQADLVLLPLGFLLYYRNFYLYSPEMNLLILAILMCFVLLFNNWITYAGYLIMMGVQSVIVLSIAKEAVLWNRTSHKDQMGWLEWAFGIDTIEIMLIVYASAAWISLRVYTCTNCSYLLDPSDIESTFLRQFNGWNCTAVEFGVINALWLILQILSFLSCSYLIAYETDTLYKEYLLKYKIIPDLSISLVVTCWNILAWFDCNALKSCGDWHNSTAGSIVKCFWFLGYPITTYAWLIVKHGKFTICENNSSKADKDQGGQLEEELMKQVQHEYQERFSKKNQSEKEIQMKEIQK